MLDGPTFRLVCHSRRLDPCTTGADKRRIGSGGWHPGIAVVDTSLRFVQRGEQGTDCRGSAAFVIMIAKGGNLPFGPRGVLRQRTLAATR